MDKQILLKFAVEQKEKGVYALENGQFDDAEDRFQKAMRYIEKIYPLQIQTDYKVLRFVMIIYGYQARTAELKGNSEHAAEKYRMALEMWEKIQRILHRAAAIKCFTDIQDGSWPEEVLSDSYRARIEHLIHLWKQGEEARKAGKMDEALPLLEMSILGRETLMREARLSQEEEEAFQTVLSDLYVTIGDCILELYPGSNLRQAEKYYSKAFSIRYEQWENENCPVDVREKLSACCVRLGRIAKYRAEYELSECFLSKALSLLKSIENDCGEPKYDTQRAMIKLEKGNIRMQLLKNNSGKTSQDSDQRN